jgi:hypothetical protein
MPRFIALASIASLAFGFSTGRADTAGTLPAVTVRTEADSMWLRSTPGASSAPQRHPAVEAVVDGPGRGRPVRDLLALLAHPLVQRIGHGS